MTIAQATGKRIQELLFKNNITQYRVSKNACLNFKTISDMIKGKNKDVKTSTVFLVCSILKISLSEFYDSPLFNFDNIEI